MEKNEQKKAVKIKKGLPLEFKVPVILTVIAVLTSVFYKKSIFTADMSDNYTISMITNCLFSQENYCLFISPILCGIVKWMCKIIPSADCFSLYLDITVWLSVLWTGYIASLHADTKEKKLFCLTAVALISIVPANLNFTVVSAFVCACGFFTLFLGLGPANKISRYVYIFVGVILIFLGDLIRPESVFLLLPFVLLHFLVYGITNRKNKKKIYGLILLVFPAILCITAINAIGFAVNGSEKYSEAVRYSSARSDLYDWPQNEYDEIKDKLDDVSENDFYAVSLVMLGDTERIDADYLENIAKVSKKRAFSSFFGNFGEIVSAFTATKCGFKFYLIFILNISALAVILLSKCKAIRKLEAIAAFVGIFAAALIFVYLGRFLERLYFALVFGCFSVYAAIMLDMARETEEKYAKVALFGRRPILLLPCLLSVVGICHYIFVDFSLKPANDFTARINADESVWQETYQNGNIFIWSTFDYINVPMGYYYLENKLPPEEFMKHHTFYGGLGSGQLYMEDHYRKIGLTVPVKDLLYRPNTYSVGSVNYQNMLLEYIKEHTDPDASMEKYGNIGYAEVWRFIPGSQNK